MAERHHQTRETRALPGFSAATLHNLHALGRCSPGVKFAQTFRHRAHFAVADDPIVDLNDTGEFAHRSSAEDFVRAINIDQRQVRFGAADFFDESCNRESRARGAGFCS